jgi:hypothetical protein
MTYDSKYAVWDETDLIYCDIKLTENGRLDWNECVQIFGQMGFSA